VDGLRLATVERQSWARCGAGGIRGSGRRYDELSRRAAALETSPTIACRGAPVSPVTSSIREREMPLGR